jgi:hypothetical protein
VAPRFELYSRQQFALACLPVGAGDDLRPRVVELTGERVTCLLKLAEVQQSGNAGGRPRLRRGADAHLKRGHERLGQF